MLERIGFSSEMRISKLDNPYWCSTSHIFQIFIVHTTTITTTDANRYRCHHQQNETTVFSIKNACGYYRIGFWAMGFYERKYLTLASKEMRTVMLYHAGWCWIWVNTLPFNKWITRRQSKRKRETEIERVISNGEAKA